MIPTPTPTPEQALSFVWYVQQNYEIATASVAAVLVLFVFSSFVSNEVKTQNAFLIIVLISAPMIFVNMGWWALLIYLFFMLYQFAAFWRKVTG
jgi:hypothetical protein